MKSLALVVKDNVTSETYFKVALDTLETIQCLEKVEILNQEGREVTLRASCIIPFLRRLNLTDFKLDVDRIGYKTQL